MADNRVVSPEFAKDEEYKGVLNTILMEGKCPFCPENFKYHKHPILFRIGEWQITRISWPYKNTRDHFLLLGDTHKEDLLALTDNDFASVRQLAAWAITEFDLPGGALTHRFGDSLYTGATVRHLHFHLVVPKLGKTVNFPIG